MNTPEKLDRIIEVLTGIRDMLSVLIEQDINKTNVKLLIEDNRHGIPEKNRGSNSGKSEEGTGNRGGRFCYDWRSGRIFNKDSRGNR